MQYKVEMVYTAKRYASVTVEAASKKEAIEKAKKLQAEDFDEREDGTATVWETKDTRSWYQMLASIFGG